MASIKPDSPTKDVSERRQQLIKELKNKIYENLKKSDINHEIKKFKLSKEEVIRVDINLEILTIDVDELPCSKSNIVKGAIAKGAENNIICPPGTHQCTIRDEKGWCTCCCPDSTI